MHPEFIRVAGQLYRKAEDLQAVENSLNAVLSAKSVLKGLGLDFSELDAAAAKLKQKSGKPAPTQKTSAVAVAPEYIRVAGRVYKRAEPSTPPQFTQDKDGLGKLEAEYENYTMVDAGESPEAKAIKVKIDALQTKGKTGAVVAPKFIRVAGKVYHHA